MSKQVYWLDAARALKKALLGPTSERLGDRVFNLAYEARKLYQEDDYPFLLELARGKKCIFDVGANVGRTALMMSTVLDISGEIVAFEASEYTCRVLLENIARNNLTDRVMPVNSLVADTSGKAIDFYWEYSSAGASLVQGYLGHQFPIKKVTLSLDDFVMQTGKKPDFIKIDVEGAEELAIKGMTKILADVRPILAIELHSWETLSLAENAKRVFEILTSASYLLFDLQTRQAIRAVDIRQWAGFPRFVLGIHESKSS